MTWYFILLIIIGSINLYVIITAITQWVVEDYYLIKEDDSLWIAAFWPVIAPAWLVVVPPYKGTNWLISYIRMKKMEFKRKSRLPKATAKKTP